MFEYTHVHYRLGENIEFHHDRLLFCVGWCSRLDDNNIVDVGWPMVIQNGALAQARLHMLQTYEIYVLGQHMSNQYVQTTSVS